MKRIVALLACLCLLAGLVTGCGNRQADHKKNSLTIAVSLYDPYDTYLSVLMDSFREYARQAEQEYDITITLVQESAGGSQLTQNAQVESFIDAGCDILCVNLVDRTEASVIIDRAEAAGIPILFFNRELVEVDLERWDQLYYVGAVAEEGGELQGQLVVDLLYKDPDRVDRNSDGVVQYVMLEGEAGHQDAIVRTEYSVATLIDSGHEVQRLAGEIANWNRAQAENKMKTWISYSGLDGSQTQNGWETIEVVFANNDDMALGVVDALKRANIPVENWPVIVGVDGTPDGLEAVKNGELYGTVLQDSDGQARSLLELALALAFDWEMPAQLTDGKYIRLPHKVVTAENVADFIE